MKNLYIFCFLFLTSFFVQAQKIKVKGFVYDWENKVSVSKVEIKIFVDGNSYETIITDSIGNYYFESSKDMKRGTYPIEIYKEGYYRISGAILIDNKTDYDFSIKKKKTKLAQEIIEIVEPKKDSIIKKNEEIKKDNLEGFAKNNLVLLIDISSSMNDNNKLDILKQSLKYLVNLFRPEDRISIITYSTIVKEELASTSAIEKEKILKTIDNLKAKGTSKINEGLNIAYKNALKNYIPNGNNKIILTTDGLFAYGNDFDKKLKKDIENGIDKNISLSIFLLGENTDYVKSKLIKITEKSKGSFSVINNAETGKIKMLEEAQSNH